MKALIPATILCAVVLLVSCQSSFNNFPPLVTATMTRTGSAPATVEKLDHGRRIFASRCIECHVLPRIAKYPTDRWPKIVNWMGPRAGLKPDQREAMLAYILAVRKDLSPTETSR